jgi:hypothetical protein
VKHKIFKNLGWKIGGLLLAFLLWFHLTTEQQFHKAVTVDVDYTNIPAGMILGPDSQKSVIVQLSSNGKRLFKILYFEKLRVIIDLEDFTSPGQYSIPFNEDQLNIPSGKNGVQVKFMAPLACDFELVKKPSEKQPS